MKLQYSDFKLLSEYINRNCSGTDLTIYTTSNDALIVKSQNKDGDDVEICCFNLNGEMNSFPQITKKTRLTKDMA